jgi:hypothetical protein
LPQAPQLLFVFSEAHAPPQQPWPLEQQVTPPVAMQAVPPPSLQALQAVTQALKAAWTLAGALGVKPVAT